MEEEDNQWILESPMTISKMESLSVLIATNMDIVVATTRRNGTRSLLTSAKLSVGYQVKSGDYKRTRQGALAALLLYLYKLYVVHATTMRLPHVHLPCFYLMSITHPHVFSIRPSCRIHVP